PANTVLTLPAGTFTVPATINIPSGVVLRGAGSSGSGATILALQGGQSGPVVSIGPAGVYDQTCYQSNYSASVNLTADAVKEATTVQLAAHDTTFASGDLALIDQPNTSIVNAGDCQYFQRSAGHNVSDRVEIASVDGSGSAATILTLRTPLHWTYS